MASERKGRAKRWLWIWVLVLPLVMAGCRYPRDVDHTLDRIRGGVLDVGLIENRPWVVEGQEPAGVEVEIIKELAQHLDAEVHWHWGPESELIPALKQSQLDLVIGGLVQTKWLLNEVALTKPYQESRITVGFPPGAAVPESLEGVAVHVHAINHVFDELRGEGAEPVRYSGSPPPGVPIAAASWWLRANHYQAGPWALATDKHVMALPPGENAWLMYVQDHVDAFPDVGERLRRSVTAGGQS